MWPSHPVIYEINTWAWLHELSARHGRPVTLGSVPESEWDTLGGWGVDAVWLMGVWERSAEGARIAGENAALLTEFQQVLADFRPKDNIGSAYCIRSYTVDTGLGGDDGLTTAREALSSRGLKLILDFVPNHVGRDHAWVVQHPEYLVQGNADDRRRNPGAFFETNGKTIACGRDPYFPPWEDVAQLNAFNEAQRRAAIETLSSIADQCDGMRCDMAMLMMNEVFARTWGERAGPPPETEYWLTVIPAVRQRHPDTLFIAEAYWDLEWALQQQGFDYCYDKRLYDRLVHENAQSIRLHLHADRHYQDKLVRFIENHDEPRAAATLPPPARSRVSAVAVMTLPGARLLHEGQFEGRRTRLPVFLRRRPPEPEDSALRDFYRRLLQVVRTDGDVLHGDWTLCETTGWPDNPSHTNLLAWCWRKGAARLLVVLNYAAAPSQGHVHPPWDDLPASPWRLVDPINQQQYWRDGQEVAQGGLFVDLGPWAFHYLNLARET